MSIQNHVAFFVFSVLTVVKKARPSCKDVKWVELAPDFVS